MPRHIAVNWKENPRQSPGARNQEERPKCWHLRPRQAVRQRDIVHSWESQREATEERATEPFGNGESMPGIARAATSRTCSVASGPGGPTAQGFKGSSFLNVLSLQVKWFGWCGCSSCLVKSSPMSLRTYISLYFWHWSTATAIALAKLIKAPHLAESIAWPSVATLFLKKGGFLGFAAEQHLWPHRFSMPL